MKRVLIFVIAIAMSIAHAGAAVRDGGTSRNTNQKRVLTTVNPERATTGRTSVLMPNRNTTERNTNTVNAGAVRGQNNSVVNRTASKSATDQQNTSMSSRAATSPVTNSTSETRTGAAYEICKSAFFTCMDQFCALKNDDYRRCSCSDRIINLADQRATLNDAGQQLTVFTENLDIVGLNAAQATAMRKASEGESALSTDTSASKALLQAIMNSISGGDTTVGGKYSNLNTINMSYDLSNIFSTDANQLIASYNGKGLYTAVYPKCRNAVADDCNNASLQRAVNAYLMAIEQDCNTVQTALDERRSQMKSAIREGSAMLDLARVENRRNHNSDDIATCINNVESAILSEEVCGANYHKCLDNGEFIDIATGAPIAGVKNFAELGNMLKFAPDVDAANQRLSKRAANAVFVSNFEKRTKMFAEPALDKCTEIADEVWSEYLDRALLAIYYAQQSKVKEIKQGCFDFISGCYEDRDGSITAAMAELMGAGVTILQPNKIVLTNQMCTDYVDSCNNMFENTNAGDIIKQYVNNRKNTDVLAACRAVVKQCFDKYGGAGYENFYYPYSGLFRTGVPSDKGMTAGDWFTLYDCTTQDCSDRSKIEEYLSPCAKQLASIDACKGEENDNSIIEQAFGGFDRMYTSKNQNGVDQLSFGTSGDNIRYGVVDESDASKMRHRVLRPVGIATEIYNQITDTLSVQCTNVNGRFVERQFIKENIYGGGNSEQPNICLWHLQQGDYYNDYKAVADMYGISDGENMCPRDYNLNVDTYFWGACLCWENGGRRSRNGKNATCVAELPGNDNTWYTQDTNSDGQVCPIDHVADAEISDDIVCTSSGSGVAANMTLVPKTTY